MSRVKFLPDNFNLALIGTLVLASLLPCRGAAAVTVDHLTNVAIALLFFLHGAKLSREAVIAAAGHWRLHVLLLLTCSSSIRPSARRSAKACGTGSRLRRWPDCWLPTASCWPRR
jgi:predicted Na+-dependent transporter